MTLPSTAYGKIYLVRNTANGKTYVGQTTLTVENRWKRHVNESIHNSRCRIHMAIRKYGAESFVVEELCECPDRVSLDETERFFVWLLGSSKRSMGYNLTLGGGGVAGTPETRKKQSEALMGHICSPETRKKISEAHKRLPPRPGTPHTPETRKRLSELAMGRRRGPVSEETRAKLRAKSTGKRHTEESKLKMSQSKRGRKMSDEIRQEMSRSRKGRISTMKGKTLSEETRLKMRESRYRYLASLSAGPYPPKAFACWCGDIGCTDHP